MNAKEKFFREEYIPLLKKLKGDEKTFVGKIICTSND
jgi:hypothetical protein